MMSPRPTVWELFAEGWRAMWRPTQVLARVPERPALPYGRLVVCMTLWGIPYAFLHFRAIAKVWLFQRWPYDGGLSLWCLLTFVIGSAQVWLIGVVGLAAAARLLRKRIPLERLEVAAVFLWMLWALMPLVDTVHMVWEVPRPYVAVPLPWGGHRGFIAHASWLVAFPAILWLLAAILRSWFGLRRWWVAWGVSALTLIVCRGIIEPLLSTVGQALSGGRGATADVWKAHVLSELAAWPMWWAARWWLARSNSPRWSSRRLAVAAAQIGIVAALVISAAAPAQAAVRTWDGGGSPSTSASTATNWSDNTVPTVGDDVVFNGTSSLDCSWDINLAGYPLGSFSVNAGYNGTITLSQTLPVTNGFTLASGTLDTGTNQTVSVNGAHSQTGGTLTANGSNLYFGTYSKTGGTFNVGTSTVYLSGAGNFTPSATSPAFYNLYCYTNSGTHTLQTALNVSNELRVGPCTLDTNSASTFSIITKDYTQLSGGFTANGSTLRVDGNFTKTGGTFTAGTGRVLLYASGNANFNPGGAGTTYYDVEIIKGIGNTVTLQGDLTVSHQLKLNNALSGAIAPGAYTIRLTGSGTGASAPFLSDVTGDLTTGTSTVVYTNSSATTEVAAVPYYNLTVDASNTFNFPTARATTISNFLFLRGDASTPITIRSTSGGVQATLTVSGSYQVQHVDVNDITSCSGNSIVAYGTNTIGANASCWSSSGAGRVPTGPGPGSHPATY